MVFRVSVRQPRKRPGRRVEGIKQFARNLPSALTVSFRIPINRRTVTIVFRRRVIYFPPPQSTMVISRTKKQHAFGISYWPTFHVPPSDFFDSVLGPRTRMQNDANVRDIYTYILRVLSILKSQRFRPFMIFNIL